MSKRNLPSLLAEAWLNEPRLQEVLRVLSVGGETRVAGGAVRNALLGVAVADVDLATTHLPADVMRLCTAAGFGVHPTGVDHGTVTVAHKGAAYEVTTLRKDVETDGRHAVVSFTQDWAEDAARRDFTMNAMYCDASGKIYDFTTGYEDVRKHKVRFVGDAATRVREDYLRILRFFRFQAWYGKAAADAAGLAACVKLKTGLKTLSAERMRQELLKILAAPRALSILKLMAETGILKLIIPHTEDWRVFGRLPADAILRLFVLARDPQSLKPLLRLSNADVARMDLMRAAPVLTPALSEAERRRILYQIGGAAWGDAVLLSHARSRARREHAEWAHLLDLPQQWPCPTLPVKGSDLIEAGFSPGPQIGQCLAALEDWWVASDFTSTRADLLGRSVRYKD